MKHFFLISRTLLALASVAYLAACQQPAETSAANDKAVEPITAYPVKSKAMSVNGEAIDEQLLVSYAKERGLDMTDPGQRKIAVEKLSEFIAIAQAARSAGYISSPEFALDRLKTIASGYLKSQSHSNPVSDADAQAFYNETLQTEGKLRYQTDLIMLTNLDTARTVAKELTAGRDFLEIAGTLKNDPNAKQAGALGWISPAQLPEALRPTLLGLQAGQTSPMISIDGAWYFIKLNKTEERTVPSFEQAKEVIKQQLSQKRTQALISQIRQQATIEQ